MRTPRRTGGPSARFIIPVVSLLLALALAGALAYQAVQAERSHRQVAERTLWDYANFAAFILASRVFESVQPQIGQDLDVIRRVAIGDAEPGTLDPLLGPCLTTPDGDPRYAFHLDFASNTFETWGGFPPGAEAWLQDTLWVDARRDEVASFPFAHLFGQAGDERVALAYTVQRDQWEQPVRAYGLTSCFELSGTSVFEISLRGAPALPPTLTGPVPNDSLLSVRVSDPTGALVFASDRQFEPGYVGTAEIWGPFGGAELEAVLRPGLADQLVTGGIPRSRLPVTLGLLSLAAILVLAALFQLRREHELVRLREGFVSSVSHELRTPLQQVLLFVELLRMNKLRSEEEETRSLEIVEEETRRLIHLVENLLQFSKAGRGEVRVEPRPVALGPVVRETVEAFAPLARAGKADVTLEVEDPADALADPDAVRRILLNLLDNAVKYGPPGQTVEVRVAGENGRLLLSVDDQGQGVAPEERTRIWEPFYRGKREDHADAGSGIGLSIVRELTALQGGEVRVEKGPSGGARFVVELPSAGRHTTGSPV